MDDATILARLDREPDAFADFYRRHAGPLLDPPARGVWWSSSSGAAELCLRRAAAR